MGQAFAPRPTPRFAPPGETGRGGCAGCRNPAPVPPLSMAFQPILRCGEAEQGLFAYEALVRGPGGEGAGSVLSQIHDGNRYAFDQTCRVRAIELAAGLGLLEGPALLSINFLPNAVYEPRACIRTSLEAARRVGLPHERLVFEFTEHEAMLEPAHLLRILAEYREIGFRTAIDDFGAGHSGLTLLAEFRPDVVKLDMALLRGADGDAARRTILRHIVAMCVELGCEVVAEGVETAGEFAVLRDLGVTLFQGYLLGRPQFEALPRASCPA
ncbi:EAL domain-containing protein [Pseudoroseomonas cervicalis]|uniref:EAL domain-containing protein n=1 Tax=Teichococcus cervicalis TaxID=204525 RepID=UPI002789355D|nr:EAL domain-containing protein [Pseudoroseomonas cervicalis]MDQ1078644.1 EAL domain-containing protein (putative c-di-GMP-specific phosphodiesterase class I) [Pseudoroseomonas cervicalis]